MRLDGGAEKILAAHFNKPQFTNRSCHLDNIFKPRRKLPQMGWVDERHVALLVDHHLMLARGINYFGRQRHPVRAGMGLSRQYGMPSRLRNNLTDSLTVGRHIYGPDICFHGAPPAMHDQRIVSNILERFVRQPGAFQPGGHNYKRHFFFPNKTQISNREIAAKQLLCF